MSVRHATWTIERAYGVPPARVFDAWADPALKVRWFVGPVGGARQLYSSDFRVGGLESTRSPSGASPAFSYEAVYRDIIVDERIVTTYEMSVDGRRMSVSVATAEFTATGDGTHLLYTELGAYFDDLDKPEYREQGTADQLDRLAAQLESRHASDR